MQSHFHNSISIADALKNWTPEQWDAVADAWDATVDDVREYLLARQAEGERFIPGEECDNFDPSTGCRGHLDFD